MNPNLFAWLALYGWPVVALAVFATRRSSARLARTTAWMLLLPVMFLPAGLELPFGALNKHRLAIVSIAIALQLFHRPAAATRDSLRHIPVLALLVFAVGASQTVRTNADPLSFGILRLPGLGPRDGVWMVYGFVLDTYLPFVIGQRVFRTERDLRDLFAVLTTCVIIYAPLCAIEMRFSPQLSNWIYGYFPHSFLQTVRGSGYRPVVFMNHGLSVAMFLFSGVCASVALHQARSAMKPAASVRGLIALTIQVLGRNLASSLYSAAASVVCLFLSARAKALLAAALGFLVLSYPTLRAYDLIPTDDILDAFGRFSPEKSASLMTRFQNEDLLLERALKRPLYGWGAWGRNRVFSWWGELGDEWADYRDTSITDGMWIIWLGTFGAVGFAASMGMQVLPLFRYALRRSRLPASSQVLVGALAVLVALFTVDLLPNAQSDYMPGVYAGALFALSASRPRARAYATPPVRSRPLAGRRLDGDEQPGWASRDERGRAAGGTTAP